MGRTTTLRPWLATMAALAVLAVSTAAVVPGPWHETLQGRTCDICRSGHLPSAEALVRVEVQAPLSVEWRNVADEIHASLEPISPSGPPRAPPAC